MRNIILIAPPVAGKGTLAQMLTTKYQITHISTGNILREVAKRNDEIGNYVLETISSGALIKDEMVFQLLEERLSNSDCKNGYVMEGFPRNKEQAIKYEEMLNQLHQELGFVIVIDVDKECLKKRVTGRRICEKCDAIFNINIEEKKPKKESVCDNCKGRLYQRSDDNLDAFERRYQTYLDMTQPLIEYYQQKGVLHYVNGNLGKDEMLRQTEKIITGYEKESEANDFH